MWLSWIHLTGRCTYTIYGIHVPYSPLALLQGQVPQIVKALHKQLKDKSVKTRQVLNNLSLSLSTLSIQGCFGLLTDLVTILPGALEKEVGLLVPGIVYCLKLVTILSHGCYMICIETVMSRLHLI